MRLETFIKLLSFLENSDENDWTTIHSCRSHSVCYYQTLAIDRYSRISVLLEKLDLENDIEVSLEAHFDASKLDFTYTVKLFDGDPYDS